jgi:ATP-binding cassette subfamily B protein
MVLQDTWLFGGTIRDNIAYGNPDATDEQIQEAARATFVDRFVHSLPDGYDTVIDEEGSNISAGEKQLVTIARALLSDRTSFVIAHRLSTIRDAHLILVMERGRIVEQGTHDELLAANGAYRRLHDAQFTQAAVDLDGDAGPAGPAGSPGGALAGARR